MHSSRCAHAWKRAWARPCSKRCELCSKMKRLGNSRAYYEGTVCGRAVRCLRVPAACRLMRCTPRVFVQIDLTRRKAGPTALLLVVAGPSETLSCGEQQSYVLTAISCLRHAPLYITVARWGRRSLRMRFPLSEGLAARDVVTTMPALKVSVRVLPYVTLRECGEDKRVRGVVRR